MRAVRCTVTPAPALRPAAAATATKPAVIVQPPSQPAGARQLPQDHHHADYHGQGHGRKLYKARSDAHHHDNDHDHHDEQFCAARLRGTLMYVAHRLSLQAFSDAPLKVSQRRRPGQLDPFMRLLGARSSGWVSPSVRSSAGSRSRTIRASSMAPGLQLLAPRLSSHTRR